MEPLLCERRVTYSGLVSAVVGRTAGQVPTAVAADRRWAGARQRMPTETGRSLAAPIK